jgi:hypothetical protein
LSDAFCLQQRYSGGTAADANGGFAVFATFASQAQLKICSTVGEILVFTF